MYLCTEPYINISRTASKKSSSSANTFITYVCYVLQFILGVLFTYSIVEYCIPCSITISIASQMEISTLSNPFIYNLFKAILLHCKSCEI